MIRLILQCGALAYFSLLFILFASETVGDPVQPCDPNFNNNETYNIADSHECDKYFKCSGGNVTVKFCEHGLRFSPQSRQCIEAKKVNCSGREFGPGTINPLLCNRTSGNFLCKNGKECLPGYMVCDGNFDCLDASDEFQQCESSCKGTVCAHGCLPNPDLSKGSCYCHPGYETSPTDKSACVDIDECKFFGSCSHRCTNSEGSYQCSCMEGFQLTEGNRTCEAIERKWKLIYATRTDIGMITRSSSGRERMYKLTQNDGRPVGVTYDARNNVTYWTDASLFSEAIYKSSLDGKKIDVVADTGILLPEGVAFDWITGNIYFADSNFSHIAVCKNDSSLCSILIQEALDKPRDIALHPNQGIMFWTDWGNAPAIMRAGMDGSFPIAVVNTELKWPNGIAVDQGNSRIYWVDARLDTIESADFDGMDRRVIINDKRKHPFGVDVFGDRVFWSDWSSFEIKSADKFTGFDQKVHLVDSLANMNGLTLFHKANQPISRSNPCETSLCSHICTLTPISLVSQRSRRSAPSFRCFCPVGMTLDEKDGKTCVEPPNTPKLVVAFKNTLKTMRFHSIGRDVFENITFPQVKSITAIVYNPVNHTLIIADSGTKKIFEYNINRKRLSVLVDRHLDIVKGMDIDVVGENLYWVDAGRQTLEVMSFRTGARYKLMRSFENACDVLVVPEIQSLFVAKMEKRGGKIYRMLMNGYSNSVVQRVGDKEPIALAYDKELGRVIWADKVHRGIESFTPDGLSNSLILRQNSHPFDLVKHESQIYWTDMFTQELKTISFGVMQYMQNTKLGSFGGNSTGPSSRTNFFGKLAVINKDISNYDLIRSSHECSPIANKTKGCSHICLISGADKGVCLCPDGMTLDGDEATCIKPSTCAHDQFTCSDGNCISQTYVCDGIFDCSHHDDEVDCSETTCTEGLFKCEGTGACIPAHWFCDGDADCADGADERNCTYSPCNEELDFRCESSGRCIPKSWQCDHAFDCPGDASDEKGCNFTCPSGFFKCTDSEECIGQDWVCDKDKDCADGSDEPPHCAEKTCPDNQFACNSGKCIDRSRVCDGSANCADSEDERDCDQSGNNNQTATVNRSTSNAAEGKSSSSSTVALVLGILVIIILVAVIIALVLHKKNIQPKVLVRPYVQQWHKYINEPARRMFGDGRGQQKLDCEGNVYDEVYAGGSASYCNTALYEEVDGGVVDLEPQFNEKRVVQGDTSRSFADSGIISSERESLYEEAEDCGSHYISYNQKDKLITN